MEEKILSKSLPIVKIENKASLIITKEFNNKVSYLCSKINKEEWSGLLFFNLEGNIGSETIKITPVDIFLMDIGSSAYTEYNVDDDIFNYYEQYPERFGMKYGHKMIVSLSSN